MKPDLIANKITEWLRPDSFEEEEELKIKEGDEVRGGKIMIIQRRDKNGE